MKLLHEVRQRIEGIVAFYGEGLPPCTDAFHLGYGCERWEGYGHDECVGRQPFSMVGDSRFIYACYCQTCSRVGFTRVVHYMVLEHYEDRQAHRDEITGNYVCTDCLADRHPEPQDGQTRVEDVEYQNTDRDHRHEGAMGREAEHHMGQFEDEPDPDEDQDDPDEEPEF